MLIELLVLVYELVFEDADLVVQNGNLLLVRVEQISDFAQLFGYIL